MSGTDAVLAAGYKVKSRQNAGKIASELLHTSEVRAALRRVERKAEEVTTLSAARVLDELGKLATVDIRDYYDDDGNLKPMTDWTPAMGARCASIESIVKNTSAADGHTDTVYKIKLWPKDRALEMYMKHHGLMVERVQVTGESELVSRLASARKRIK